MGGDEGTERLCELAFLCFTFFWLFLFAPDFVRPTAESLSVFHRNSVPILNIKKDSRYIDFDKNKIIKAHRGKKKTIIVFTITAEIHACSLVKFYCQYADRHMKLKFMRARVGNSTICYRKKKNLCQF